MLLFTLSEDLTIISDWISANLSWFLPIICSPVVIFGIVKLIMFWITCVQASKQKQVKALNGVKESNTDLANKVQQSQELMQQELIAFEDKVIEHIEAKFTELRNKRVEMYNKVASITEQVEKEAIKIAPQKQEDIKAVVEAVENKIEETETQIEAHLDTIKHNAEEYMR